MFDMEFHKKSEIRLNISNILRKFPFKIFISSLLLQNLFYFARLVKHLDTSDNT